MVTGDSNNCKYHAIVCVCVCVVLLAPCANRNLSLINRPSDFQIHQFTPFVVCLGVNLAVAKMSFLSTGKVTQNPHKTHAGQANKVLYGNIS